MLTWYSRATPHINAALGRVLPFYVDFRWKSKPPRRHSLSRRLIISVTSYPVRFQMLPFTLKCLLSQSVAADHVILWIAREDEARLTREIISLQDDGLTIRLCDDLGSYKKIVPALVEYGDAHVVTADDDIYYGPTWLEELVTQVRGDSEVLCHRAHRIRTGPDGLPLPYKEWEIETRRTQPSSFIFPTTGGGVLYPPGTLHPDAVNPTLFRELCPSADDIWLYWMMRKNGAVARKVGSRRLLPTWKGTQRVALFHSNFVAGANDKSIKAMIARFGFPDVAGAGRERLAGLRS